MKKLILLLLPLFLFMSCEPGYFTGIYEYEFVNNTSSAVTLNISGVNQTPTIQPNNSYKIAMDHHNSYTFVNNPRTTFNEVCSRPHAYYYVYIENMNYVNMLFFNSSSYEIVVTEQNNLLGDNYGDTLTIPAGQTRISKVYTTTPTFNAVYSSNLLPATNALSYTLSN